MAPTRGLVYAAGKITNPKWTQEAFNNWYNTVHVPQTLSITNGPKAGFRFFNQDASKSPFHYLALYPVADLHADISDAAEKLKLTDDLIPDGEPYLNFSTWDVRHYRKLETIDANRDPDIRIGKQIVTVCYEPGPKVEDPDLWYDPAFLKELRTKQGYLRMHGYELEEARAASGKDSDDRKLPKFLAVVEFGEEEIPPMHMEFTEPSEKRPIYKTAALVVRDLWEGIYAAGEEKVGL